MPAPTIAADLTALAAVTSGNVTPTLPAHLPGDVICCPVMCWAPNTAYAVQQGATPAGWTRAGLIDFGENGYLALYWKRAGSDTVIAPTFVRPTQLPGRGGTTPTPIDTGADTCFAASGFVIRGAATLGDPFETIAVSSRYTTANQSFPLVDVNGSARLAVQVVVSSDDQSLGAAPTGWTGGTAQATTTGTDAGMWLCRQDNVSTDRVAVATTIGAPAAGGYGMFALSVLPAGAEAPAPNQVAPAVGHGVPAGFGDWRFSVEALVDDEWADLTGDCEGVEWERGASEPFGLPRTGSAALTFRDDESDLDPWSSTRVGLSPGTLIRFGWRSATDPVGWVPAFTGHVATVAVDVVQVVGRVVTVNAYDTVSRLAAVDLPTESAKGANDDPYERLARVAVDRADWPHGLTITAIPVLDTPATWELQSTTFARNALELCQIAAQSCDCELLAHRDGSLWLDGASWYAAGDARQRPLADASADPVDGRGLLVLAPSPDVPLYVDRCDRADHASTPGGLWVNNLGAWGIAAGSLQAITLSGGAARMELDTGAADHAVQLEWEGTSGDTAETLAVSIGATDPSNRVYLGRAAAFGTWNIYKVIGGTHTFVANIGTVDVTAVTLRIEKAGNVFRFYTASLGQAPVLRRTETITGTGAGTKIMIQTNAAATSRILAAVVSTASAEALTAVYDAAQWGTTLTDEAPVNDVRLTRVGGAEQRATDDASIALYGRRTLEITDLANTSDTPVATIAARVLARRSRAIYHLSTLELDCLRSGNPALALALVDYGDRIRVHPPAPVTPVVGSPYGSGFVRSIRHRVAPRHGAALDWTCSVELDLTEVTLT